MVDVEALPAGALVIGPGLIEAVDAEADCTLQAWW